MGGSSTDLGVGFLELEELGDEDRMLQSEAHRVAAEVLRPAARVLDAMAPTDRVAPGSPFFEVMGTLKSLGYHRLFLPVEYGGPSEPLSPLAQALVLEELGWGSLGLTTAFLTDMLPFTSVAALGSDELKQALLVPWAEDEEGRFHGCWAITEPDHGSDFLGFREGADRSSMRSQLVATRQGDGWVLHGQKSAWVSSGPVATHAAVHAQAGPDGNLHHSFFAVVPLDVPGVRKGAPADMLGVRDDPQGEIFFDDVFVPDANVLIGSDPLYAVFGDQLLCVTSTTIAPVAVGVARAAFEEALAYARSRVQGGVPITEHKNIQLTLYAMFEKIEAARAYARQALAHVRRTSMAGPGGLLADPAHPPTGSSPRHSRAAQILAKRVAYEVAHDAVQVCGAFGLSRESLTEKLLRDARCLLVEDGTLEVLAFDAARDLVAHYETSDYDLEEVMARW